MDLNAKTPLDLLDHLRGSVLRTLDPDKSAELVAAFDEVEKSLVGTGYTRSEYGAVGLNYTEKRVRSLEILVRKLYSFLEATMDSDYATKAKALSLVR